MQNTSNIILPFTIYNADIKGRIIRLDDQLDIIIKQHAYPEDISRLLSELLMAAALLGSQFKDNAILTIQLETKGRLKYIVVDYQAPGHIRGYAQTLDEGEFVNDAILNITVDHNGHRYQGIVEVNDMDISKAIEEYFRQSEQIKTSIKLAVWNVDESWCAGGIMIQKLPTEANDDQTWEEANAFFSTIRDKELIDSNLLLETFLYSVYHEASVRVYDYLPMIHKCRCSHERASVIVKSLGFKEAKTLIIDGNLSVNCQFCNISQNFTKKEIEAIYSNKS